MFFTGAVCFAYLQTSLQYEMFPRNIAGLFA